MESIKGALQQRDERTIPQQWYIWYTQPRAEKQLQKRLAGEGIEVFLPLRKELHQWSDRKKWVEVPLFRGYLFTKISMRKFEEVRRTNGIVTYVRFNGKAATLGEGEIHRIQQLITDPEDLEVVYTTFEEGERVQVIAGPLMGIEGLVVQHKGSKKVAVNIEKLGHSILVDVPIQNLRKLGQYE
jgi:transcription antitermination factor NusG